MTSPNESPYNYSALRAARLIVIGLVGLAAGAGCSAGNLIGEVRGGSGGSGTTIDASGESIVIEDRNWGIGGAPAPGIGGSPAPGIGGRLGGEGGWGSPGISDGGAPPPPIDGSVDDLRVRGDPACPITYPPSGFFGENIFAGPTSFVSDLGFDQAPIYELAANVPLGFSLTFTITGLGGTGGDPSIGPVWLLNENDFRMTSYNPTTRQQTFQSRLPGLNEGRIYFQGTSQGRIDFYECGAATPTRVETFNWGPAPP